MNLAVPTYGHETRFKRAEKVLRIIKKIFPEFVPATNVLDTSIHGGNFVIHPPSVLCNAGQIEKLGAYLRYYYDLTPAIARVMEKVDEEKMAVCGALGLKPGSIKEGLMNFFGGITSEDGLYEAICKSYNFRAAGPADLKTRYVTEDVPYGLCPVSSIGDELGVETPTMKALIQLASVCNAADYWKQGITTEKSGLRGLTGKEMMRLVSGS